MSDPQRRRRETGTAYKARAATVGRAEAATAQQGKEDALAPWKRLFTQATGQKYGIATAGKFNSWMAQVKKRKAANPNLTMRDLLEMKSGG